MNLDINREDTEPNLIFHETGLQFYDNETKFPLKDSILMIKDGGKKDDKWETTVASKYVNNSEKSNEAEYKAIKDEMIIEEEEFHTGETSFEVEEKVTGNGSCSLFTNLTFKEYNESKSEDATWLCNHLEKKHGWEAVREFDLECENACSPELHLSNSSAVHIKLKIFKCIECDYTCSRRYRLALHISEVHRNLKLFECEECKLSFSRSDSLARHISAVHKKSKPFMCGECDFSFSQKIHLSSHILTVHKKLKLFKCDECDYSCSQRCNLAIHVSEVHKKLKSFKCEVCKFSFSRRNVLARHISAVHEKSKPYKCSECDFSCSRKSDLSSHTLAVHKKLKLFKCDECAYSCSRKYNLALHISKVH